MAFRRPFLFQRGMSKTIVQGPQSRAHVLWDAVVADAALQRLDLELIRVEGTEKGLLIRVREDGRIHTVRQGPGWRRRALEDVVRAVKGELLTCCMAVRSTDEAGSGP